MAKKKSEGTETPTADSTRRMSIDLDPAATDQVNEWCAAHPLVNKSAVRELVRSAGANAANVAVLGNVDSIVRASL